MMRKHNDQTSSQKKGVDLDSLKFDQGGRLMSNQKFKYPDGSKQVHKQGYDEIFVPAKKHLHGKRKLIQISELPSWTHAAFKGTQELNMIQSSVYKSAFESPENLLVCAPTGAGKTNIALLTIL